jgi:alanyl-tRNA synthetase
LTRPAIPTEKLYWADAHALAFETRGATVAEHRGKPTIILKDVAAAVTKLRAEMKTLRDRLESSRTELAGLVASRLRDALAGGPGPHIVHVMRPLDDLAGLRALANELTKDPRIVALVAGADEGSGEVILVVQRGIEARLDCGALVLAQARAQGGRGGGRPERAEGRFPHGTSIEVVATAASAALAT